MRLKILLIAKAKWLCLLLLFTCCDFTNSQDKPANNYSKEVVPYSINNPAEEIKLPGKLKEVSGMSWYNGSFATINDENGDIYIVNSSGEITEEIPFDNGDNYEGIAVAGEYIIVANANGDLFRLNPSTKKTEKIETPLSGKNDVEGMVYDESNNRLLIACKEDAGIEKKVEGRAIYAFDLSNNALINNPIKIIKVDDLNKHLEKRNAGSTIDKLGPSGIAIHPKSGNIYIVSHQGKSLMVFDKSFKLLEVVPLSKNVYAQPEGICFSPNGTLYISNEGNGGRANILRFSLMGGS